MPVEIGGTGKYSRDAIRDYEQPIQVPEVVSLSLASISQYSDKPNVEIAHGNSTSFMTRVHLSGEEKRLGHEIPFEVRKYGAFKNDATLYSARFEIEYGKTFDTVRFRLGCNSAGELTTANVLIEPGVQTTIKNHKIYSVAIREKVKSPNLTVACIPR